MRTIKQIINLLLLTVLFGNTFLACEQNKDAEENKISITLPSLSETETLCYEDNQRRIIAIVQDDGRNVISVQAKQRGIKEFKISSEDDYPSFEGVVGNALVISKGTGNVRMLNVVQLTTGTTLLPLTDHFQGGITPDEDQSGFSVCKYSEETTPQVHWNAEVEKWQPSNSVPAKLLNQDLKNRQNEVSEHLFSGMRLAALQKVHVDIKNKKVTHLDEYQWSYVE